VNARQTLSPPRDSARRTLAESIRSGAIPPFVYCYPTRSAYRELDPAWTVERIWQEEAFHSLTNELNLYLHVPFCRYKCGFCNLYTVISEEQELHDAYTDALCRQLDRHREIIQRRTLKTVYIGGGTPTLLSRQNFEDIFARIEEIYPNWRATVEEVCVEATPDSIVDSEEPNIVRFLMDRGLTRVNMGVQSMKRAELREAGRSRAAEGVIRRAVEIVEEHRLPNLSTDLIMGFAGQTNESWRESVEELVALDPETISTYFLTIRPDAWFSRTGKYRYQRDPQLYERYDVARAIIGSAGYVQESNVRYKRQGLGGYRQKVLQFRGVPVLGIGAGARTYTNTVDYITGGSAEPSLSEITAYVKAVRDGGPQITAGFVYDDAERIRKRLVLDLFDLDLSELAPYRVEEHAELYEPILEAALDEELLLEVGTTRYQLTPRGYKYRDILSWMLFSEEVVARDREFYERLHGHNARAQRVMIDKPSAATFAQRRAREDSPSLSPR
jgi:oxygen-independent coproporphyrinogen III oxidase